MDRKLGRKPRGFRQDIPHYSSLRLAAKQPPLPTSADWLKGAPDDLGYMCNDKLGDCPIAGIHHARQVWTYNTTGMVTDPDADVLHDYETICGYDPNDPSTDQGGVLQDVLAAAVKTGITTKDGPDKLLAFYEVDVRNIYDVRRAIAEAGVAYIGIDIPQEWAQTQPGGVWDATESPVEGGHCVILTGYDGSAFDVVSWGMRFRMTVAGFQQACDETYAVVDRNWIKSTGFSPANLSVAQLEEMMESLR